MNDTDTDGDPREGTVYSIGYAQLTPETLVAHLDLIDGAILLDVRSVAAGPRVRRGFRREELTGLLGARYEHRPELGGRKAIAPAAIERLVSEAKAGRRVVLMCQEHAPGECHRHHAIGVPLAALGVTVWHLFEGEVVSAADLQASFDADDDGYDCYQFADVFGCAPPAKGART